MSENKKQYEGVHLGGEEPFVINKPNPEVPKESYAVFNISTDHATGLSSLHHRGNVEAADIAEANAKATQAYGFQQYDYVQPKTGKDPLPKMGTERTGK
jgi:hypothetical protein